MGGFLLGLGVAAFLSLITVACIWFSRKIPGMASISIVQAGILIKVMMGSILSMAVFKFTDPTYHNSYTITLGIYVCSILPLLSYFMVKKDCTTQTRIKNIGKGNKRIIKIN